jgi:hypothetical protein
VGGVCVCVGGGGVGCVCDVILGMCVTLL